MFRRRLPRDAKFPSPSDQTPNGTPDPWDLRFSTCLNNRSSIGPEAYDRGVDLEQARAALRRSGFTEDLAAPTVRLRLPARVHPPGVHVLPAGSQPCRHCRRAVTQFSPPGRHIAVAAGFAFSLALTAGGDVDAWGENDHGQLGHDTTHFEAMPRRVEGLKTAISAIAAGGTHALALTVDAAVFSWGSGSWGQLGTKQRHDVQRLVWCRDSPERSSRSPPLSI